jgi:hypothetical protein
MPLPAPDSMNHETDQIWRTPSSTNSYGVHLFDTHPAYFAGTLVVVPGTDTRSLVNISD